jgi:cell division transport system permease protein
MGPVRYVLGEVLRSLSQHRALCLASVVSMSAILLIFLLFVMILTGVDHYAEQLESREEISVFLDEGLGRSEIEALRAKLMAIDGVDSLRFISKDEAWEQFRADLPDEALLQAVGGNPLPASFVLRPEPAYRSAEGVRSIAREAETLPHVEDVRYAGEWVLRAEQVVRTLHEITPRWRSSSSSRSSSLARRRVRGAGTPGDDPPRTVPGRGIPVQ